MSFFDKLVGELVDIIEVADAPLDSLVYRFPRYQNEIKYGARLIVREGQGAIFINQGKLAEVFGPGTYTLEAGNLPVLSTLLGWKYGFHSPFKAEVYFFSTRPVLNQQWGTQQAITMELPGYGLGDVRAYGQVSYRITDPAAFFRAMVGTTGVLTDGDQLQYLRGLVVAQFSQALIASHPSVEQLMSNLDALDATLQAKINETLTTLGFELTQFLIESLSLPPALRDEIFEYSRLNNIDIGKFTRFQAAKVITDLAGNETGAGSGAGAQGIQLGVGLAAAQQVMRSMNTAFEQPAVPPPLPPSGPQYHVAIGGKAQGPLALDAITQLVAAGTIDAATLVWHPGMTAWAAAGSDPGLRALFSQAPPPLP
ncbi:MAG TPA: SPFH domain-containing protein [Aliidongia sp.]|uniref:SPFH domain-containing protein n=1 Tax=Aliidongia sp. TaxID=1914230 RepID=UPI002DDD6161|nr:SPFH domain-containing protein [Aliidongia sp.]HEV2675369.1 SPFH domain-containing protein [Aliidongia sp.]